MPTLLKTAGVFKLKSYWLKRIQLADSAVMKGFLKATSEHMNGFPKANAIDNFPRVFVYCLQWLSELCSSGH
jgi:hypothetical protein